MSLVENLVSQISTSSLGGVSKPQGFDLNDETFAKLLEKASAIPAESLNNNLIGEFGVPAGLHIEPFDAVESVNSIQQTQDLEPAEIKDVNMDDYFSSLLKNPKENTDFINFATKHAANAYNVFGRSLVSDIEEFAQGAMSIL